MTMDGLSQAPHQVRTPREAVAPARRQKLQVSLSDDERRALTERARAGGFDSVAAYVRAQTLGHPVITGTATPGVMPISELKG